MPRPTPPVKRVCYADDITVWATEPKIPQLESMINSYLRDVRIYLKDNSRLFSAPKSTVTLFTPDKHQFQMHPVITLEDTQLPLERSPKILGVIMDPSLSFHRHCNYVSDRIDKRNNMLKAVAGSSWGSRHLATRGNNKILRTPPPHISSSEERLPRLTRRSLAQLRRNKSPFLKSYLHKVDAKHIHHHYDPTVTSTHTTHHLFNCTHIRTTLSPLE